MKKVAVLSILTALALTSAACGGGEKQQSSTDSGNKSASGQKK
jgi:ABC-type glycerol-3-phosphate transport system substrate-binding protein